MQLMRFVPMVTLAVVERLLRDPHAYWQYQGFGMLRCYLSNDMRLQVWDRRFAVPDVTVIHDHPWDFTSLIVAGRMENTRYHEFEREPVTNGAPVLPHMRRTIQPGVGLKVVAEDVPVWLVPGPTEEYAAGMIYEQAANEVHWSQPEDGTVTVIQRNRGARPDVASSYYPVGKQWVSAEPRDATSIERNEIIEHALAKWFR